MATLDFTNLFKNREVIRQQNEDFVEDKIRERQLIDTFGPSIQAGVKEALIDAPRRAKADLLQSNLSSEQFKLGLKDANREANYKNRQNELAIVEQIQNDKDGVDAGAKKYLLDSFLTTPLGGEYSKLINNSAINAQVKRNMETLLNESIKGSVPELLSNIENIKNGQSPDDILENIVSIKQNILERTKDISELQAVDPLAVIKNIENLTGKTGANLIGLNAQMQKLKNELAVQDNLLSESLFDPDFVNSTGFDKLKTIVNNYSKLSPEDFKKISSQGVFTKFFESTDDLAMGFKKNAFTLGNVKVTTKNGNSQEIDISLFGSNNTGLLSRFDKSPIKDENITYVQRTINKDTLQLETVPTNVKIQFEEFLYNLTSPIALELKARDVATGGIDKGTTYYYNAAFKNLLNEKIIKPEVNNGEVTGLQIELPVNVGEESAILSKLSSEVKEELLVDKLYNSGKLSKLSQADYRADEFLEKYLNDKQNDIDNILDNENATEEQRSDALRKQNEINEARDNPQKSRAQFLEGILNPKPEDIGKVIEEYNVSLTLGEISYAKAVEVYFLSNVNNNSVRDGSFKIIKDKFLPNITERESRLLNDNLESHLKLQALIDDDNYKFTTSATLQNAHSIRLQKLLKNILEVEKTQGTLDYLGAPVFRPVGEFVGDVATQAQEALKESAEKTRDKNIKSNIAILKTRLEREYYSKIENNLLPTISEEKRKELEEKIFQEERKLGL